jgi:hypothetical protein
MVGRAQGDEWVSISEAARIMECSKSWVRILIDKGDLTAEKIHQKAWLVSKRSAAENLARYRAESAGKRKVGRPRANNAPDPLPPGGRRPGRRVQSDAEARPMKLKAGSDTIPISDLVSITTAAQESGMQRSWLHVLIARGDIGQVVIDGKPFLRRSELAAFQPRRPGRPAKSQSR